MADTIYLVYDDLRMIIMTIILFQEGAVVSTARGSAEEGVTFDLLGVFNRFSLSLFGFPIVFLLSEIIYE